VNLSHLLANGKIISVSASFSTSNFVGPANSYGNQMQEQNLESSSVTAQCQPQTLPSRPKTQRPRVPPPSKVSGKHATLKRMHVHIFFSYSKPTENSSWLPLQAFFFLCGLKVWGDKCVRVCMRMSTSACLCPVLMLHFGRCDGFSIVIRIRISTVLRVILNYVFMLCTKLIYSLLYNQNNSVAA